MKNSPWQLSVNQFWEECRQPAVGATKPSRGNVIESGLLQEKSALQRSPGGLDRDQMALPQENGLEEDAKLVDVADWYLRATGEEPHEIIHLSGGTLIETSVLGSYEVCPNGYLPIFLSQTSDGWIVWDTGHSAQLDGAQSQGLLRDGNVLYLTAGPSSEEAIRAIGLLVSALRTLNEGEEFQRPATIA